MTLASQSQLPLPTPPRTKQFPVLPPFSALIEISILFGLIVSADWLHPGVNIADIRPHPFWAPVLLLSLQYGTASGLLAAGVAIAITAFNGFPEQSTSETYFSYFLKIWIEPILWVGAAVLLGQFRMRQIAHKQALVAQITELANQHATISDYTSKLRTYCTALERQIAGRSEPDVLLVLAALNAASLSSEKTGSLDQGFSNVMALVLPGARATLYTADPSGLRLAAVAGPSSEGGTRAWIATTDPLYRAIVDQARSISVLTKDGETLLASAGLAAVPVRISAAARSALDHRIVGMLKIEEIDPAAFGRAVLPALEAIAHALAPRLEALLVQAGQLPLTPTTPGVVQTDSSGRRLLRHFRWFGRGQSQGNLATDDASDQTKSRVTI